jgi:hypothetical protein
MPVEIEAGSDTSILSFGLSAHAHNRVTKVLAGLEGAQVV